MLYNVGEGGKFRIEERKDALLLNVKYSNTMYGNAFMSLMSKASKQRRMEGAGGQEKGQGARQGSPPTMTEQSRKMLE